MSQLSQTIQITMLVSDLIQHHPLVQQLNKLSQTNHVSISTHAEQTGDLSKNQKYILMYASPEASLVEVAMGDNSDLNEDTDFLDRWYTDLQHLVKVKQTLGDGALLVNLMDVLQNTYLFQKRIQGFVGKTEVNLSLNSQEPEKQQVTKNFAAALVQTQPKLSELYKDVLLMTDFMTTLSSFSEHNIVAHHSSMLAGLQEIQHLSEQKLELERDKQTLETENELSLLQIHQLQEELESTHLEKIKINETVSELESENELSLLQIHQLQEELEFYYLKYNEQSEVCNSLLNQKNQSNDSLSIFSYITNKHGNQIIQ